MWLGKLGDEYKVVNEMTKKMDIESNEDKESNEEPI
jgi:hypothetical protein